jgi:hypothetical protein
MGSVVSRITIGYGVDLIADHLSMGRNVCQVWRDTRGRFHASPPDRDGCCPALGCGFSHAGADARECDIPSSFAQRNDHPAGRCREQDAAGWTGRRARPGLGQYSQQDLPLPGRSLLRENQERRIYAGGPGQKRRISCGSRQGLFRLTLFCRHGVGTGLRMARGNSAVEPQKYGVSS